MSTRRKRNNKQQTKGEKGNEMARKKEERAVKAAYHKEKKAKESVSYDQGIRSFSNQLAKMGLQLREIPGDGNCLFRALGDQLDGHGRNHLEHRKQVVNYMKVHREDFEPFVEDDVPFDRHISNLAKPGTYAGNDTIVAFARLHTVTVVIHQVSSPCWEILGSDNSKNRQLHISYHNGDHYSSVRKLDDHSENIANIRLEGNKVVDFGGEKSTTPPADQTWNGYCDNSVLESPDLDGETSGTFSDETNAIEYIMKTTNCMDLNLIRETLQENLNDVDATVDFILHLLAASALESDEVGGKDAEYISENGICPDSTDDRLFGNSENHTAVNRKSNLEANKSGARPKMERKQISSRQKRQQAKLEKKQRAVDRHRQRILGLTQPSVEDDDSGDEVTVVTHNVGLLQI